jgi:hypothetical protein
MEVGYELSIRDRQYDHDFITERSGSATGDSAALAKEKFNSEQKNTMI